MGGSEDFEGGGREGRNFWVEVEGQGAHRLCSKRNPDLLKLFFEGAGGIFCEAREAVLAVRGGKISPCAQGHLQCY